MIITEKAESWIVSANVATADTPSLRRFRSFMSGKEDVGAFCKAAIVPAEGQPRVRGQVRPRRRTLCNQQLSSTTMTHSRDLCVGSPSVFPPFGHRQVSKAAADLNKVKASIARFTKGRIIQVIKSEEIS